MTRKNLWMCLSLNQCCFCVSGGCNYMMKGHYHQWKIQINTDSIFMEPWNRTTVDGYGNITSKMRDLVSDLDLSLSARLTWLCTSSWPRLCTRFRPRHSACLGNTSWSSSGPWQSSWWWCSPWSGLCDRSRNRPPRRWSTPACRSPRLRSAGVLPLPGCKENWVTFSPRSFHRILMAPWVVSMPSTYVSIHNTDKWSNKLELVSLRLQARVCTIWPPPPDCLSALQSAHQRDAHRGLTSKLESGDRRQDTVETFPEFGFHWF